MGDSVDELVYCLVGGGGIEGGELARRHATQDTCVETNMASLIQAFYRLMKNDIEQH